MKEKVTRLVQVPTDTLSIARLVDHSLGPGGSISLSFSEGIIHITLDRLGDWTITVGLSARSDRLLSLVKSLEELGFFRATENEGVNYLLWTSALQPNRDNRTVVEEKLLKLFRSFQASFAPSYIG